MADKKFKITHLTICNFSIAYTNILLAFLSKARSSDEIPMYTIPVG